MIFSTYINFLGILFVGAQCEESRFTRGADYKADLQKARKIGPDTDIACGWWLLQPLNSEENQGKYSIIPS